MAAGAKYVRNLNEYAVNIDKGEEADLFNSVHSIKYSVFNKI